MNGLRRMPIVRPTRTRRVRGLPLGDGGTFFIRAYPSFATAAYADVVLLPRPVRSARWWPHLDHIDRYC